MVVRIPIVRSLVEDLEYWEGEYACPAGLLRSAATRIRNLEDLLRGRMDRPSVGRIVHYVAYGTPGGEFPARVCRAAVITEVGSDDHYDGPMVSREDRKGGVVMLVGLCVLNPTGQYFNRGVPYSEEKRPGTWHWPERT